MALWSKTLGDMRVGWMAGFFGTSLLSSTGSVLRPLAKGLIKGGLFASEQLKALVAETVDQVNDLVAEVQAENARTHHAAPALSKRKYVD